ncbi:unnamed protein product [Arabis nemorensis]|uniref:Uncharacterized protein n=1 Tax=Arabis nemorensis TaxID=586526 RepID=A0A565BCK9_9BRAS|nr:unnamed protein product [Arabis nemorensis]
MDDYLRRVMDIVDEFRISGNRKPDHEVFMELPDMTLVNLLDVLDLIGSRTRDAMLYMMQDLYLSLKIAKSQQKWCGVCKDYNHNQVDCY